MLITSPMSEMKKIIQRDKCCDMWRDSILCMDVGYLTQIIGYESGETEFCRDNAKS